MNPKQCRSVALGIPSIFGRFATTPVVARSTFSYLPHTKFGDRQRMPKLIYSFFPVPSRGRAYFSKGGSLPLGYNFLVPYTPALSTTHKAISAYPLCGDTPQRPETLRLYSSRFVIPLATRSGIVPNENFTERTIGQARVRSIKFQALRVVQYTARDPRYPFGRVNARAKAVLIQRHFIPLVTLTE